MPGFFVNGIRTYLEIDLLPLLVPTIVVGATIPTGGWHLLLFYNPMAGFLSHRSWARICSPTGWPLFFLLPLAYTVRVIYSTGKVQTAINLFFSYFFFLLLSCFISCPSWAGLGLALGKVCCSISFLWELLGK